MDREGADWNREGTGRKEEGETGWYIKLKKMFLKKKLALKKLLHFSRVSAKTQQVDTHAGIGYIW